MIHAVAALKTVPIADPDLGGQPGQVGLDDLVAERGAQPHGVVERGDAVGMAEVAVGRAGGVADPQPAGVGADLGGERPRGRWRAVRVADGGPGGGVEQRGAVADRAGQRVLDRPAARRRRRTRARAGCGPGSA